MNLAVLCQEMKMGQVNCIKSYPQKMKQNKQMENPPHSVGHHQTQEDLTVLAGE